MVELEGPYSAKPVEGLTKAIFSAQRNGGGVLKRRIFSAAGRLSTKRWRSIAVGANLTLVTFMTTLFIVLLIQSNAALARFEELHGGSAGNDMGQRGQAIGFFVLLIALYLAAESTWQLSRARPAGFVLNALLWLLMLPVLASAPFPEALDTFRATLQILCLAASVLAVVLGVTTARVAPAKDDVSTIP